MGSNNIFCIHSIWHSHSSQYLKLHLEEHPSFRAILAHRHCSGFQYAIFDPVPYYTIFANFFQLRYDPGSRQFVNLPYIYDLTYIAALVSEIIHLIIITHYFFSLLNIPSSTQLFPSLSNYSLSLTFPPFLALCTLNTFKNFIHFANIFI